MPSAQASADPRPVREHLERILSGTAFAGSERASTFLRHVVEHQLCLPGTPIKESTIGIAVFDKEPGFDPKVDPIVRIYAGRVRQRLERYYETEGRNDSLRIVLPKGSYVPEFHTNSPASIKKIHALPLRMGRVWPWKPLGAAALLAVAVYLGVRWVAPRRKPAPAVRQLTFDASLTTDAALTRDGNLLAFASDRGGRADLDIWVRQTEGGEPIRLTNTEADDREPSFSPDGTKVAFHSDREGGGVYVMPALGGESNSPARRLAPGGRRPLFSPDGQWIAYWAGSAAFANIGSVYVVPSNGGNPRKLNGSLAAAGHPVWHPDGKHLLVAGGMASQTHIDWFVVPIDGGPAAATDIRKYLETERWLSADDQPLPDAWQGNEVFFTSRSPASRVTSPAQGIWKLRVRPGTWVPAHVERLTHGSGQDVGAAVAENGRLVFSGLQSLRSLFELRSGRLNKLQHGARPTFFPSLSKRGERLAYTSSSGPESQIWVREMPGGQEEKLTDERRVAGWSRISPDGTKVAYATVDKQTIVIDRRSRHQTEICKPCVPVGWSPDSSLVSVTLEQTQDKIDTGVFSVADQRETARFVHPQYSAMAARFSPDGLWLVINVKISDSIGVLHLIPWTGVAVPPEKWIPITEQSSSAHFPEWSSDGRYVFYFSNRLGSFDLWQVPVREGRRVGEPALVRRFAEASLNLGRRPLPFAVGPAGIVLSLDQTSGNLWILN